MRHDPNLARAAARGEATPVLSEVEGRDTVLVRAVRRSERMMMLAFVVCASLAAMLIPGRFLAAIAAAWVRSW